MTDEGWQLAYAIYEAAAPLAEPERQKYVHAATQDTEIAGKVLAMLAEADAPADSDAAHHGTRSEGLPAGSRSVLPNGSAIGRFAITGFVGHGGIGQVYSAYDPDLNREVALKVIAREPDGDGSEPFIREAQAASALNHPNIVTVHEVIRTGPSVAIAMELVTGTSMRLLCGTPQPVARVAVWGSQIAHALEAAHARGIVHRDVKPENLMLRPDGYVKVLDFGLARQAGSARADGELATGTLGYMSPEEVLQRPITAASDVFSLGIVLYELASGTNPFRGESPGVTTRLIQGAEAPSLQVHVKGAPHALDRLLQAMLAKSPGDRPTAADVAARLEAIAGRRTFRRRTVWAGAVLGVCTIGGIAAWDVSPFQGAKEEPVLRRSLPFNSEPASETAPAFSPDGGSIVYASDSGSPGIHHIMIRKVGGAASSASNPAVVLTSGPYDDTNPVWSSDGSRVAFLRKASGEIYQAVVVPVEGGSEQVIADVPGYHFQPTARKYLTWAPDGQALVAGRRVEGAFGLRLNRFPLSGGDPLPVTEGPDAAIDVSPAYSPDGRWLAYLRWENGATYGLWLVPANSRRPTRLITSPFPITTFAWKPDSRTIVYGGGALGTGELWEVTVDGRRTLAPFVLEGASDEITIAPRANRLAYVLQNLDSNIWRVPLDRTRGNPQAPEKLFASVREETDAVFSPDGTSIAFISNRSGHWSLWVGNADGSGLRELPTQALLPFHPAWSPDSREIVFDSKASGNAEIWIISAAGGPPRRLITMPGGAEVPSWSRDGKRILFYTNANGTRQIWEAPATGGSPVQLTRRGSFDPLEAQDGHYLYYGNMVSPGVWRSPLQPRAGDGSLANQDPELIQATLPVTGHRFWALGQGGIYFVDALTPPAVVKFVDLASRQVSVMATLAKPPAKFTRTLSISPDGRYALYCQDDVDRYEIRVVENFR